MGQVQEEQKKGLLQRPADLTLIIYLILAAFFALFRGLVSLPWLPPPFTSSLPPQPPSPKIYFLICCQKNSALLSDTQESSSPSPT